MNRRDALLQCRKDSRARADDTTLLLTERIAALTELYFLHNGDSGTQGRIVREIHEIAVYGGVK